MATLRRKIEVEQTMRQLLEDNNMPQPDAVEYGFGCVRFFYKDEKLCFVIDIDDPEDGYGEGSAEIEESSANAGLN